MKRRLFALLLAGMPALAHGLTTDEARHLLLRTEFDADAASITRLAPLDRAQAVQELLDRARRQALTPPPAWVNEPPLPGRRLKEMNEQERRELRERLRERALDLKGWWYREMLATDSPLTERMTLFWHNHFTSGLRKVKSPALLYRQNELLRRYALGNFRELLHAVARDPAMVVYLDSRSSRRQSPNENFARELLELFTLGNGYYSERDIKETARAFTGWSLDPKSGAFRFYPQRHDDDAKEFLGQRGRLDGDDILDILLAQPRTAEHITEKLWREFISETPDPAEVARLAALFRASDYELKPLLRALLTTRAFWDENNRATLVKAPVELIVGTLRSFEVPMTDTRPLALAGARLGQDLFDPPSVKGWPGGQSWITSATLLARQQVLERLVRGIEARMGADQAPDAALRLAAAPVEPPPAGSDRHARLRAALLDPVYQLK